MSDTADVRTGDRLATRLVPGVRFRVTGVTVVTTTRPWTIEVTGVEEMQPDLRKGDRSART